ncbi:hypothetical protein CKO31_24630 [Thiohalocapsa halophila]|uniref:TNase-like domain-containing protein n=1 Tax=Thiohalocapsa halophila TaxID=69359 RepID=A0ABS1CPI5_9GAMM|nr:hypothetical protein [Thiohalocapsa halophila]MBK1633858.1 hypothetical protein [Thiohalocapsa halophila]
MRFKLPRTYKLLLALAVVVGPFYWLMFTEDGRRRSDLFLLHVLGKPGFNIAYDRLSGAVTRADIEEQFPKIDFQCAERQSALGDKVCGAEIASFNGLPARRALLHYGAGRLTALRLDYRPQYHRLLAQSLRNGLGEPTQEAGGSTLRWRAEGGTIVLPAKPPETDANAALMWVAPALTGDY